MSPRRPQLLNDREARRVERAFAAMLPLDGCLDPRLRGVVADVLSHPGSLARAQLAYGLGVRRGLAAERALQLAVAVEYFHSASLLFDDMPSMDDARERRGHPCPHVVYGEAATTLGALALITRAYALLWEAIGEGPGSRRTAAAALVSECLGLGGILDGQARDVHFRRDGASPEAVAEVAVAKTVPLIRLALVLPALVAGEGAETLGRLERLAASWGLAYQILDDFKDGLMGDEEAGKTTGRDAGLGRPNLPALTGPRRALARLRHLLAQSRAIVDKLAAGSGERWAPLESLQGFLETEARDVEARLVAGREAA
ncbi:MAG TPA: polyprenyl synthetase family protein [Thermoanaerobaculia bacterium]|nr:polyprenyl synthetase family protein [Thermoanaerobaculia bacterium]